jgi:hypothetical protein
MNVHKKVVFYFSRPFPSSPMFWTRLEPTLVKHLPGAQFKVRLLAVPTSIRIGWKGLPGMKTLA